MRVEAQYGPLSDLPGEEMMGCQDCPNQPANEQGEPVAPAPILPKDKPTMGWVVYTGGTPERHLAMMQHTLPEGYTRAKFLSDGSIEYEKGPDDWEPPSPIEGYERDAENQWLFRPLWKSCQLRMYGTVVKEACECIQVHAVCSHPEVRLDDHGEVNYDVCKECPHRMPIQELIVPKPTPLPKPYSSV
jgi:hypothetical protein